MKMWQGLWDKKKLDHDAWDKLPHAGGKKVGRFRLTCRPYWERLCDMPEEDLELEGWVAETLEEFRRLVRGHPSEEMCVIRFYKLEDDACLS